MFVFLVACYLTVEEGEWLLDVFKEAAEHIISIAGNKWRSTFTLGKLNKSGPYLTPMNLPKPWSKARKYIKVHGDALNLVTRPRRRLSNLCITFGLAGKEPLDEDDIYEIGMDLKWKGISFVNYVKPRPASMNEVEASLNE